MLDRLDVLRQDAYATGDPDLLRDVYAPGSAVLRRDRRTLMAYERRSIQLEGVRLEIHNVEVRRRDGRQVWLRVVDRLTRPTAHTEVGEVTLPQDLPTRRLIVLVRHDGEWRIAAVRRIAG